MACGTRIYKGEETEISIPFNISGATNINVSLYTDGEYAIDKPAEAVSGNIVVVLERADLDLLQDGVIRYTINYDVDGIEYSDTSNLPNYLKTPAGYSAITPDDIYQSGYTAGSEDCSGGTGGRWSATYHGTIFCMGDRADTIFHILGVNQTWEYIEIDGAPLNNYTDIIGGGFHDVTIHMGSEELAGIEFLEGANHTPGRITSSEIQG